MNKDNFILYEWNHETKEFWFLGEKIDYIHNPTEWREHLNNLVEENKRLKENNQSMQEEMCRSWEKLGKLNSILEEIREEIIKVYPSSKLLQILDKVGKE